MAKVQQGFLGNASGKLGSVVFAKNRKTNTVRKHQPIIQDKKSPAQLTQRQAMKVITSTLAPLKNNFIPFFNKGISGKASPWSYAIKQNINSLDINGNFDLSKLQLGKPSLQVPLILVTIYNPFTDQIYFKIDPYQSKNIFNLASFIGQYKSINQTIQLDSRHLIIPIYRNWVECYIIDLENDDTGYVWGTFNNAYDNGRFVGMYEM
jgi:hypothetical protein